MTTSEASDTPAGIRWGLARSSRFFAVPLQARIEVDFDAVEGTLAVALRDANGELVDGAAGVDALADRFLHRGGWCRFPRAVAGVFVVLAEHAAIWQAGRGFVVAPEDVAPALRALRVLAARLPIRFEPGAERLQLDDRPLEPVTLAESIDDQTLELAPTLADPDHTAVVPLAEVLPQLEDRTWIRIGDRFFRRPNIPREEIERIRRQEVRTISGDEAGRLLAGHGKEGGASGVVLGPRARRARVVGDRWRPFVTAESAADGLSIALAYRVGGEVVPAEVAEASGSRWFLRRGAGVWLRNDPDAHRRAVDLLLAVPGVERRGEKYSAPLETLPLLEALFESAGPLQSGAKARAVTTPWGSESKIELAGDGVRFEVEYRAGDLVIPWESASEKGRAFRKIDAQTWARNDPGRHLAVLEAIGRIPGARPGERTGMFQAPRSALPAVRASLGSVGNLHLGPRAARARFVTAGWRPHVEVDLDGPTLHLDVSFETLGGRVDWGTLEQGGKQGWVEVSPDTWVDFDARLLGRAREALASLPGVESIDGKGAFRAPAQAVPLLEELDAWMNVHTTVGVRDLHRRLFDFEAIEPAPLPVGLLGEMRPYQKAGYDWLCFLQSYALAGVLADDMGLGKTLQALAALLASVQKGETAASLVVCPASVTSVWEEEVTRWCNGIRPVVLDASRRLAFLRDPRPRSLAIASYQSVARNVDAFSRVEWSYLILDEAHKIKNPDTATARACKSLRARYKLAVTGTPIQNRLSELWSLFDFLLHGYLGSRGDFEDRFAHPIGRDRDAQAAHRLRRRIDPFKLRRVKEQVAKDLPTLSQQVVSIALLPKQRELYRRIVRTELRQVVDGLRASASGSGAMHALTKLLRLRQVCAHPRLVDGSIELRGTSAKLEVLAADLEQILAGSHRALVFTQWTQMAALIRAYLAEEGIEHSHIDGTMPQELRKQVVKRFQERDGPPVMVLSLHAAGEGITLTAADYVFLYDRWWNPAVEDQAIARAHRISQKRPVTAYILEAADTVEQRLSALLAGKRALAAEIVTIDEVEKRITREDLLQVLEEELASDASYAGEDP